MAWTRREFVFATMAAAGSTLVGRPALGHRRGLGRGRRADTYFDWKEAAVARVAFNEGGNALVVPGEDGALLIDCKNAPYGGVLRREAESAGKLSAVINTHHHGDHTGGNYAFASDLLLYAHEKAKPRITGQLERYKEQITRGVAAAGRATRPGSDIVLREATELAERVGTMTAEEFAPTRTVGDNEELEVAGRRVVLHHFGPGHTDNDIVVHLPDMNLLHTGDLLFHRLYPFWDPQGGVSGAGWIRALEEVAALCNEKTVVVPGHGEITDRSGVQGGIRTLELVRDAAAAAIKAGQTKEQFLQTEIPELTDFGMKQMAKGRVFGGWYDELSR